MNFKTTLILLVLLAGAAAAVWFTKDKSPDAATETPAAKKLLTISGGDIQTITITPASGKKIVAARDGMNWKFTEPFVGPAEAGFLNALVSDLTALESQTSVEVSDGSGLKSPRFVLDLTTKDGKTTTLSIG